MTNFRTAFARDWKNRVTDLLLHGIVAVFLPGAWWMQFAPDVALPALFWRSWRADAFLPYSDPALKLHRALHGIGERAFQSLLFVVLMLVAGSPTTRALALHIFAHWCVDRVTHDEGWQ